MMYIYQQAIPDSQMKRKIGAVPKHILEMHTTITIACAGNPNLCLYLSAYNSEVIINLISPGWLFLTGSITQFSRLLNLTQEDEKLETFSVNLSKLLHKFRSL